MVSGFALLNQRKKLIDRCTVEDNPARFMLDLPAPGKTVFTPPVLRKIPEGKNVSEAVAKVVCGNPDVS